MKKTNNSRFGSPSEWENELGGSKLYKHKIYFTEWGGDVSYFVIISQQKEAFDDFNEAMEKRLKPTLIYLNDNGDENYFVSAQVYPDGVSGYGFNGIGMDYEMSIFNTENPFNFGAPIRDPAITDEVEEL